MFKCNLDELRALTGIVMDTVTLSEFRGSIPDSINCSFGLKRDLSDTGPVQGRPEVVSVLSLHMLLSP
jgi:hypothetical protein